MQRKRIATPLSLPRAAPTGPRTILLIGLPAGGPEDMQCSRYGTTVKSEGPLSALLLSQVLPDAVVIPLFTAKSDAMSDVQSLSKLGFRGRCFVLAPRLPNRRMVVNELRQQATGLRIYLLHRH